jgi:hypothetical protein
LFSFVLLTHIFGFVNIKNRLFFTVWAALPLSMLLSIAADLHFDIFVFTEAAVFAGFQFTEGMPHSSTRLRRLRDGRSFHTCADLPVPALFYRHGQNARVVFQAISRTVVKNSLRPSNVSPFLSCRSFSSQCGPYDRLIFFGMPNFGCVTQ